MADTPSRGGVAGSYLTTYSFGPTSFGATSGTWFGPLAPMQPLAPPDVEGRVWDYPVGYNLNTRTRAYEPIGFGALRDIADGYDLLRVVIETRKDQLARMAWSIKNRDSKANDKNDPRVAVLQSFFRRPDGYTAWHDWLRALLEDLFVLDAPALYAQRTRGGDLVGLVQLDGSTIKPVIDPWGRVPYTPLPDGTYPPAYQQILKGLPAVNYSVRDLLYRPRNKRVGHAYGYSPVEQIVTTVNIALRRQLTTLEYFTSGNMPDSLIGVPETWTPDQIVAFQRHWDANYVGDLAARRRAKFVPGGVAKTYVPTREPELKNDFDEWLAKLVCFTFSISPQALIKQMNRASGETQKELAEEEGLTPLLLWLKGWFDDIIEQEFDAPDLEFSWDDDEVDEAQQVTTLTGLVNPGIMTRNEARDRLGLDPLPDPEASQAMITTASGVVPLSSFETQQETARTTAEVMANRPVVAAPGAPGNDDEGAERNDVSKYAPDQPRDARGRFAGSSDDAGLTTGQKAGLGLAVAAGAYLLGAALHRRVPYRTGDSLKEYFSAMSHRDVIEQLHKTSVHTPITEAERKSLVTYTGSQYKSINKKLRLGHKPTEDINNIDAALQKSSLSENAVVYRGLNMDRSKRILKTEPGDVFVDRGYPSTSISEDVARRFASSTDGAGTNQVSPGKAGYVLSINVDKGASALPLATGYSQSNFLHEVLLPRSSAFKVLSVDDDSKTIFAQHLGVAAAKAASSAIGETVDDLGDAADRHLWCDADLEFYAAPEGDTTAEDYAGYRPPQADMEKAYDPSEARDNRGEWTGGGADDDWTAAKDAVFAIAKGVALTAAVGLAVSLAPETFAIAGGVAAGEAAIAAGATAEEAVAATATAGKLSAITKAADYAAETAFYDAAFTSGKVILRHLGFDTAEAESKIKSSIGLGKATKSSVDAQLKEGLVAVVDHTRDEMVSHLESRHCDPAALKAARGAIDTACQRFKDARLSGLGKLGKRKTFAGYRRPEPVPFDRPATRRAETGIRDRLTKAFATIGRQVGASLKDRLGKVFKADDPSPEDRARQIADEIASEFDFGPLHDTTEDTADDLSAVAEDSVSNAVAQIGPSDPGDLVDQVNSRAVAAARDRAAELVGMRWDDDGNLVPSRNPDMAITETTRDELRGMIVDGLASNIGTDALAEQIAGSFALSPERAAMIAATEVSRANSEAALESYKGAADAGVDVKKEWLVAGSCCDACAANAAAGPIDLDAEFPSGDDTPPGHPNCRCSLTPVVGNEDADKVRKTYDPGEGRDAKGRWVSSSLPAVIRASRSKSGPILRKVVSKVRKASQIQRIARIDVRDFRHTISSPGVAHTLKMHGDETKERARGQIAVEESDFALIGQIVSKPDAIAAGDDLGRSGQPRVAFRKEIDGIAYEYVGEVQSGRRRIEMVTMWKT